MGFNSGFKGLMYETFKIRYKCLIWHILWKKEPENETHEASRRNDYYNEYRNKNSLYLQLHIISQQNKQTLLHNTV